MGHLPRIDVTVQTLNITIFRIIAVSLAVRIVNVFVFHAISVSAFAFRFQHSDSGIALIFGQEGNRPPKSKGTHTSMTLWTLESVVVLFHFLSGSIYFVSAALSTYCAITTQNGIIRKKIEA